VREAREEHGVDCSYIGSIDADAQTFLSMQITDPAHPKEPAGVGLTGWQMPKQLTTCQHTVSKNDTIVANASWDEGEGYSDMLGYGKMGQVQNRGSG
jgi:hypothetical protein